jgi:hypothetical protein
MGTKCWSQNLKGRECLSEQKVDGTVELKVVDYVD